jgi:hypothetical protein
VALEEASEALAFGRGTRSPRACVRGEGAHRLAVGNNFGRLHPLNVAVKALLCCRLGLLPASHSQPHRHGAAIRARTACYGWMSGRAQPPPPPAGRLGARGATAGPCLVRRRLPACTLSRRPAHANSGLPASFLLLWDIEDTSDVLPCQHHADCLQCTELWQAGRNGLLGGLCGLRGSPGDGPLLTTPVLRSSAKLRRH